MLTQDLLNEIFTYDPETGKLERRVPLPRIGNGLGEAKRYPQVSIAGKSHSVHRIVWLLVYGHIPNGMTIDHINGVKSDNRLSNLRLASQTENKRNVPFRSHNTTGFKGVYKSSGKYFSSITVQGIQKHLGTYSSPLEAALAYDDAAIQYFGEFARTNSMMGLLPNISYNA